MGHVPLLPEHVLENWRDSSPGEAEGIIADVRSRLAAAIDAWELTDLVPMPGGEVALVLAVSSPLGEAVLKVNPSLADDTDVLAREPHALGLWSRAGVAPRVYGTRDDGMTLLLERVRPGMTLREATTDALRIVEALGALCPFLHQQVNPVSFSRLADGPEATAWRRELVGTREYDELEGLLQPGSDDRLLHTDLHCINALRSKDRWVVIDPKPHLGDRHAEVFVFMYGAPLRDIPHHPAAGREHVRRLTSIYANAAGLDRDRMTAWLRVRALAVALWAQREEPDWARELFHLLETLG
jgi:streptomycin 6-kinase